MTHDWRCACSYVNPGIQLHCDKCRKQRWVQLGVTFNRAQEMLWRLLPDHMLARLN